MWTRPQPLLLALCALCCVPPARAAVQVDAQPPKITKTADGERVIQTVTLANEVAIYSLCYDITRPNAQAETIGSHWWVWTTGMMTLGMTEPSNANWYFQGFLDWRFDDEALHVRPATIKVLREGGPDGVVQYTWDTPTVKATLTFALTSGSDKLLMYGHYEPKGQPFKQVYLRLGCYPTGFAQPRHRAISTQDRTVPQGQTVTLDPKREKWVLFEDTTEGRPGDGPAGVLIGTPDSFQKISIPVGDYGIFPRFELKPDARDFALGLYSFPTMPECEQNRTYFRASGTREAEWLGAHTDLSQPLPPLPVAPERQRVMQERSRKMLDRPAELWRPDPAPLAFDWAKKLPGQPLKTVLFCPRWAAWETMELARRLNLQVDHFYFDQSTALTDSSAWPYRNQTGIGPFGLGFAVSQAATLAEQPGTELYLCANLNGSAIPPLLRTSLLSGIKAGRGLLLAGTDGQLKAWPKELFAKPDPALTKSVSDGFAVDAIPGFRPDGPGRPSDAPPYQGYDLGQGRVIVLRANLNRYAALVPRNNAIEGLDGATDRSLALAARAALVAAKRAPQYQLAATAGGAGLQVKVTPAPPAKATLQVRVQDDMDRVLSTSSVPAKADIELPVSVPAGRGAFCDLVLRDAAGQALAFGSAYLTPPPPLLGQVMLSPVDAGQAPAVPTVQLPDGGALNVTVPAAGAPAGANAVIEVWDAVDRLVAQASAPVADGAVKATLNLPAPVTVCQRLEVSLRQGDRELAFARQRFTLPMDYPYDDYTSLVWTYCGGDPVLRATMEACYRDGVELQDLCHVGAYDDTRAAREFEIAARTNLRLIPYVTRLAGEATAAGVRQPCLHAPGYLEGTSAKLTVTSRQAKPYSPAAFTLGDENYLFRGGNEGCWSQDTVAAYQTWLEAKYGNIIELNRSWGTRFKEFTEAGQPLRLGDLDPRRGYAQWLDHQRFMDTAFAQTHETFADVIQQQVPDAKVGFDGLLGYGWQAGYDFVKLTANLRLNQVYTTQWLQCELMRSFRQPGALTGQWGNAVADSADGFRAWVWDGLLNGNNSVWWWTSWGCDYIPFNPDLSLNTLADGFYQGVRETSSGPGKLLLHAARADDAIGILYSQPDLFAATAIAQAVEDPEFAGTAAYQRQLQATAQGLLDLGLDYKYVSYAELSQGRLRAGLKVLVLPLASCLSEHAVEALRSFVEGGGTLLVDGRAGLLDANGTLRDQRPLDELLGVTSPAGAAALTTKTAAGSIPELKQVLGQTVDLPGFDVRLLEPGLQLAGGTASAMAGKTPVMVEHAVGRGRTVLLNFGLGNLLTAHAKDADDPLSTVLSAALAKSGVAAPCELEAADGGTPHGIRRHFYTDGANRYLALQRDLKLGEQKQSAQVKLPQQTYVYDLRKGGLVAHGQTDNWSVELSRAQPQVFSLLPYHVTAVKPTVPATVRVGQPVKTSVTVAVDEGQPGYHTVRLDVYPPGAKAPHRQYSQNVGCDAGQGTASFTPALNDPVGEWRLTWRDVATGVKAESRVKVSR